jgi:F-box protein 11
MFSGTYALTCEPIIASAAGNRQQIANARKAVPMSKYPVGFWSYVRADDAHDAGYLSTFRIRLSGEVYAQTGEMFDIFQDREDIAWGANWEERINDCIDAGMFLICIITPRFFKSDACRNELERFVAREKELGRNDLILPIYYITCPMLEGEARRETDPLAQLIRTRNYVDWRDLRFEPLDSPKAKKKLADIATDIREALETRLPAGVINKW